jgi:tetratricopeptide (TPR) repeat protein
VAGTGLSCALAAPHDASWRSRSLRALEPLAREALRVRGLSSDDRAALYDVLTDARWERGDAAGARAMARRWWAFLEADRRNARTAEERAALDGYRVAAAEAMADPARALPALAASERELPGDYNPPARTARLLVDLGRLAEARAAADRALALAYGPRKLKLYQLAANIEARRADPEAEKRVLDEALGYAESLPAAQQDARTTEALRARRVVLGLRG